MLMKKALERERVKLKNQDKISNKEFNEEYATGYDDCMFNHLASLAKWLSVRLRIKWLWVRVPLDMMN